MTWGDLHLGPPGQNLNCQMSRVLTLAKCSTTYSFFFYISSLVEKGRVASTRESPEKTRTGDLVMPSPFG